MLSVDGPVKQRLETLAGELAKAADKELQVCWRRSCGHDLKKEKLKKLFLHSPMRLYFEQLQTGGI